MTAIIVNVFCCLGCCFRGSVTWGKTFLFLFLFFPRVKTSSTQKTFMSEFTETDRGCALYSHGKPAIGTQRVPGLGRAMTLALTTCSTEEKMDNIAFTVTVLTLPRLQPTLPADYLLSSTFFSQPTATPQPAFSQPSASLQPSLSQPSASPQPAYSRHIVYKG